MVLLAAVSSAGDGQIVIVLGAVGAFIAAICTLIMLGPNRRSKAMEIAEKGIEIAEKRALAAEHEEVELQAEVVLKQARVEALERKIDQLRARLRENKLDDS